MLLDKMSNLKQRVFISLFVVVILFFSIYFANHTLFKPFFALEIAAITSLALHEFYVMAYGKGFNPLMKLGILFTFLYIFFNFLQVNFASLSMLPLITSWLFVISLFGYYFVKGSNPISNIALTLFGFIYLTIPLSFILQIAYFFPNGDVQDGRWWLFYLLLLTKVSDVAAYFIGRQWGHTKIAPYISPKKSWEGAIAGLLSSIIISILFIYLLKITYNTPPINLSYFDCFFLGASISLIGQFGDLAESLLKRDVGIKDSSHLPGFGGILDLVDSLVFTCPFLYFYLKFLF